MKLQPLASQPHTNGFLLRLATFTALNGLCFFAFAKVADAQTAPGVEFTLLHRLNGSDGSQPLGGLVVAPDGNLYGTANSGGTATEQAGTIFKITPGGLFNTLYSFTGSDGSSPQGLTLGNDGKLYGANAFGGTSSYSGAYLGLGNVFTITTTGVLTNLHTFQGGSDGDIPNCAPVQASDGYFYGTTIGQSPYDNGTIYKVSPSGEFTTLYSFAGGADGGDCQFAPVQGPDGNFYGTTPLGGASYIPNNIDADFGSIYRMTPSGVVTTLYSFTGGADGSRPECQLAVGQDGCLYGTTEYGGANSAGTIFKITTSGKLTTLHAFDTFDVAYQNTDGGVPAQGLITATDGNFYGMTSAGGPNATGTIYSITSAGTFTLLHAFGAENANGSVFDGGDAFSNTLTESASGALYGVTISGAIFKLTIPGLTKPTRFDFNHDGFADLIWYNTGTGGVSIWDMSDQSVLQYGGTFAQFVPSSGLIPVASPDANGDGYPDLLWWNSLNGNLTLYELQNTTITKINKAFAQIKDTSWKPVAVADNSGSAWTMVLQNKVSGDIARWLMSGDKVVNVGPVFASLGPHSPWQVVGAPDLDGDGHSDLLFWNSSTGEVSYWGCNLANSQVLSYNGDFAQVSDTSWHLMGSEDTNGDGHPDLIWWNATSGAESRWLLNGTTVTAYGGTSTQVADTTWQPTAIR